jgi:hypothetical protein
MGELEYREFVRVANVHRADKFIGGAHQPDQGIDQVVHIAE